MPEFTAVGIDLGTTNSVVAHGGRTGVEVLLNRANDRCTRSVVALHKNGEMLIGSQAVDYAPLNPESTIFSIKRLMGRFYDDRHVQEVRKRYQYRIVKAKDGDDARVMLGDKLCSPVDISALILGRLKEDARTRLNEPVTHAVITVPAYFSVNQRMATRDAGEQAGLRVKTILSEPTAAAMAYGVDHDPDAEETVLVYDLGGGTFDISILSIHGGMFDELGLEGDMWLGGDDFDYAIMRYLLEQVKREFRHDPSDDGKFMLILQRECERAKIRLSEMQSTAVLILSAFALPSGSRPDVEVEVSRRQFEDLPITDGLIAFGIGEVDADEVSEWCRELEIDGKITDHALQFGPDSVRNRIKKTRLLARKAMKEAGVTKDEIQRVLLVGGSTTVPLVQHELAEEFGAEKIMRNIDPMTCVAVGAGIAAERIQRIICQNEFEVEGPDGEKKVEKCIEPNDLNAQTCRKCGKKLVAEKLCPGCGSPNDLGAEQCAACGRPFKEMGPRTGLTPQPIAIWNADGEYEAIVPKGTPFPTMEAIVVPFVVARDSQDTVRIPFYQAEQYEFDPKDAVQWVGSADIDVKGAPVLAGTRGDLHICIDEDGCPDIDAIIQDGSGRHRAVRLNLNRARERPEQTPRWAQNLQFILEVTEFIALRTYDWLIPSEARQRIERLVDDGKAAIDRNDEAAGARVEKDMRDILEREIARSGIVLLINAEVLATDSGLSLEMRGRIGTAIQQLCAAMRGHGDIQAAFDGLDRLITEARAEVLATDSRLSLEMRERIGAALQQLRAALQGHGDIRAAADGLARLITEARAMLPPGGDGPFGGGPGDVRTGSDRPLWT
jgi:molecular chaperone DnaK (HSP70)